LKSVKNEEKIIRIGIDAGLVEKELEEACYDLKSAEKSVKEENYKWAIFQSYYSMFMLLEDFFSVGGIEKKAIYVLNLQLKFYLLKTVLSVKIFLMILILL